MPNQNRNISTFSGAINTRKSRENHCCCIGCTNRGAVPFVSDRHPANNTYMCQYHATVDESYFTENNNTVGSGSNNLFTYSFELETSSTNNNGRGNLMLNGFIATRDGSIRGTEYKSPIYNGMIAAVKGLQIVQRQIDKDALYIGNECGTHLHIGRGGDKAINAATIEIIANYYHSLFVPLSDHIWHSTDKGNTFFGRALMDLHYGYANRIDCDSNPVEHENFINLQHPYSIEYRLPVFRNLSQYRTIIHCLTDITKIVTDFADTVGTDRRRETRPQRIAEAQKAAAKIVATYRKYSEE